MRGGSVVLLALVLTQGCSSSYQPARSPRIATVIDGGYPTFVKDGEHIGSPAFGTGLVDATSSNPRAQHHARVGRNLMIGGIASYLVGLGTGVGGLVLLAQDDAHLSTSKSNVGTALAITGIVGLVAGSVMMLSGQPHIYDAVNIYNDGLDAPLPRTPVATSPY